MEREKVYVEESECVPDQTTGYHQTWVNGATHHTTERVPSRVIEPIPEGIEALFGQDLGGSTD